MFLQYWGLDADIVQVYNFDLWVCRVCHKNNHSRWKQQEIGEMMEMMDRPLRIGMVETSVSNMEII